MRIQTQILVLTAAVALLALASGCPQSATTPIEGTTPEPAAVAPNPSEGAAGADSGAAEEQPLGSESFGEPAIAQEGLDAIKSVEEELSEGRQVLHTIYFAFDSFELSDVSLSTIKDNVMWLKAHPNLRVVVEGHCDERGTIEYNLDLGAKRARAVRDHMLRLGLPAEQVETITYGEERPADPGHDEAAWARNRRAEFHLEKP